MLFASLITLFVCLNITVLLLCSILCDIYAHSRCLAVDQTHMQIFKHCL